ncbi:MAG: carboxylesterase/lipase family protein [Gammaproteobacteria bacterium]
MAAPLAAVRGGTLRGLQRDGARTFLGIPYAAPPLGELRLRAPHPAPAWQGERDATAYGPIAPQPDLHGEPGWLLDNPGGIDASGRPIEVAQSEDCLTLNVFAPEPRPGEGPRPVLVWLHGGGLRTGAGRTAVYDGTAMAREGRVVVVTINYRLGILGWLCHPELREGDGPCGNWGMLDQIAALDWVRDNIAAFGGDPGNVTVAGQSAGASSIAGLLACRDRARFHKAIAQSAAPKSLSLDEAAAVAERIRAALGVASIAAIRTVPAPDLVAALKHVEGAGGAMALLVSADGFLFRDAPMTLLEAGAAAGVPLLFGTTRDEWRRYLHADPRAGSLDRAGLLRRLERAMPGDPEPLAALYEQARAARGEGTAPWEVWFDACGDSYFRIPAYRLAAALSAHRSPVFAYRFDWPAEAEGGRFGAMHAFEIPFAFGNTANPEIADLIGADAGAAALSRHMLGAWSAFAHRGDPGTPDLPAWPRFDAASRRVMALGRVCRVEDAPLDAPLRAVEARIAGRTGRPLGITRAR